MVKKGWAEVDGVLWYSTPTGTARERGRWATCEVCGTVFPAPRRKGRFCTRSCMGKGIVKPRPSAHPDLFAEMTPEECWLIGLIWADGCLGAYHGDREAARVILSSTDREIADHASRISGAPAHFRPAATRGGHTRKPSWSVGIGGRGVVDRLRRIGLVERKSLIARMPDVDHPAAFARGYFDGDGHVGLHRNPNNNPTALPRLKTRIVGAFDVLSGIQRVATGVGISEKKISRAGNVWQLNYNHADSLRFADLIYADGGPHLARKRQVYEQGRRQPFGPNIRRATRTHSAMSL